MQASPAAKWLDADKDRAGRVVVAKDLTAPGHPDIFVVGDTAAVLDDKGQPVPGIAPAAKQMGAYAARVIFARLAGSEPPGPFRYRHAGSLATIGRSAAIADFGWLKVTGWLAWWLWGIAHIYFLIDFRSRFIVAMQWFWSVPHLPPRRAPDHRHRRRRISALNTAEHSRITLRKSCGATATQLCAPVIGMQRNEAPLFASRVYLHGGRVT